MKIRVLGSAAGGGFPQWNCNCRNCLGVRSGTRRAHSRTQSSLAVCGDDPAAWALVNASPDIRAQLAAAPALQRPLTALCVLIALQGAVGLDQYETHLPTELVWVHVALASLTWLAVLWAACAAGSPMVPREALAAEPHVAPPARVSA